MSERPASRVSPARCASQRPGIPRPRTLSALLAASGAGVPVVVCIDIEPDDRQLHRDRPEWHGVEPTVAVIEHWRAELAEATGAPARFSWFWRTDPQVAEVYGDPGWGIRRYRDVFVDTSAAGDAHGVHPHAWRRRDPSDHWIQDRRDPTWVEHCIDASLDAFREATGERCRITRFGDRALDAFAYRRIARHGVRVDLSVEPGEPPFEQEANAPSPDFASAPVRPYRPRRHDIARARRRGRGPVLLPLSATTGEGHAGGGTRLRTVYPWLPNASTLTTQLLDRRAPYLAFAVRSDISLHPELRQPFEELLATLAEHRRAPELRFVTPLEAVTVLGRSRRDAGYAGVHAPSDGQSSSGDVSR